MAFARIASRGPLWLQGSAFALALAFAGAGDAVAKSAPRNSERPAAPAANPAPARSFTMNQILARADAGRPGAAGRVAAAGHGETAIDAARPERGAPGPEPFGLFSFKAPDGDVWTKWRGLESALAREAKRIESCRADAADCGGAAKRYVAIVEETRARTGRARLETANRLVNGAIRYVGDLQQHGDADRWTAPLATLAAAQGDCEDFAAAKYAVLRDAGVSEADMRLVLLRDTSIRVDHAVLAVRLGGEWLVLDNGRSFVAETGDLKHYTPLFALDRDGVKLLAVPYAARGEGAGDFAGWQLRGTEFAEWNLRGSDAEPAAAE